MKICAFFCDVLDWIIGYLWRAPKAWAKFLGYFVGRQHMTSFLFKLQGGVPPCPPPAGAHGYHRVNPTPWKLFLRNVILYEVRLRKWLSSLQTTLIGTVNISQKLYTFSSSGTTESAFGHNWQNIRTQYVRVLLRTLECHTLISIWFHLSTTHTIFIDTRACKNSAKGSFLQILPKRSIFIYRSAAPQQKVYGAHSLVSKCTKK